MRDEDIKLIIKNEYENGVGVTELSRKYNKKINTINTWRKRGNWKKKENIEPKKNRVRKNKSEPFSKIGSNDKNLQIKKDLINGATKEEIMSKNGISERTYYRKIEDIRKLRLEVTQKYLNELMEEVYQGKLKEILKKGEQAKANLTIKTITELKSDNVDYKKIESNEKAFNSITKMLNNLARNGDILSASQMNEIEAQLVDENIKNEYLQLEKEKNKIVDTDNKIEIDLKGV